jgi:hypothetical protein
LQTRSFLQLRLQLMVHLLLLMVVMLLAAARQCQLKQQRALQQPMLAMQTAMRLQPRALQLAAMRAVQPLLNHL